MKEVSVSIDQAGRIVLPKAIRQALSLKAGDFLNISSNGESVTLTPKLEAGGLVRKGRMLVWRTHSSAKKLSNDEVNALIDSARSESGDRTLAQLNPKV